MESMKLIQVSDTHLSKKRAYAQKNWEAVLRYIEISKPDLVIHTGDVILDDPDDMDDFEYGFSQIKRIPSPWRLVPGGHDLGDSPPDPWMGQYITKERRDRYIKFYKTDRWSESFAGWRFIGINCQLFGSGLKEEEPQWKFLEGELVKAKKQNVAIFFHKPPCQMSFDETIESVSFIPYKARKKLLSLILEYPIQLICTGHRHRYITFRSYGASLISAPTTGLLSDEDDQAHYDGILRNGIVEYLFSENSVKFSFVEPPGIELIHYQELDPSIPRGSRFLPLFEFND